MSEKREGRARRAEDEAFAERLAANYSPGPLSLARRAVFDDALAARLERRRHRLLLPALAAAAGATAAALAWLAAPGVVDPAAPGRADAVDVVAGAAAAARWELDLLDPNSLSAADDPDEAEWLPDDYVAIAGFFLDG